MNLKTFENLLHAKAEWHQTIEEARLTLRYATAWPWEERRMWENEDCIVDKRFTNFMMLTFLAEDAVKSLGFPEQITLQLYWMACFYNDYKHLGLDEIKLWSTYWAEPRRVYPYVELKVSYDNVRKTYSIEFHELITASEVKPQLADLLSIASRKKKGEVTQDIHRAKVRRDIFIASPEARDQIKRAALGELTYTDALKEEYGRTIEGQKDKIQSISDKYTRESRLQSIRRRVREKVRQRFRRAGLPIQYKRCKWWIEPEDSLKR
jgi:hypothetical protein